MSEPTADKHSRDLWYLSDARSVWESSLCFKRSNGHLISRIITFLSFTKKKKKNTIRLLNLHSSHMNADACTAQLTATHIKSAVQSRLLCVDCTYSQPLLQSLDTVSWWLTSQRLNYVFLRCSCLGKGRLYVKAIVVVGACRTVFDRIWWKRTKLKISNYLYKTKNARCFHHISSHSIHRNKYTTGPVPNALSPNILHNTPVILL